MTISPVFLLKIRIHMFKIIVCCHFSVHNTPQFIQCSIILAIIGIFAILATDEEGNVPLNGSSYDNHHKTIIVLKQSTSVRMQC